VLDAYHREFVQPNICRALEVILGIPWTYSIDIWNGGCMVRKSPRFPEAAKRYRFGISTKAVPYSPAKILDSTSAEVEFTLPSCPPLSSLLAQGRLTDKFISEGKSSFFPIIWSIPCLNQPYTSKYLARGELEERETCLQREDAREAFCVCVKCCSGSLTSVGSTKERRTNGDMCL
jgi:hypothetical protein